MNTQERIGKLRTAMETAVDTLLINGGKLMSGGFRSNVSGAVCPISATIGPDNDELTDGFAHALEVTVGVTISEAEMWEFVDGFDAGSANTDFEKLGAELRLKYKDHIIDTF